MKCNTLIIRLLDDKIVCLCFYATRFSHCAQTGQYELCNCSDAYISLSLDTPPLPQYCNIVAPDSNISLIICLWHAMAKFILLSNGNLINRKLKMVQSTLLYVMIYVRKWEGISDDAKPSTSSNDSVNKCRNVIPTCFTIERQFVIQNVYLWVQSWIIYIHDILGFASGDYL